MPVPAPANTNRCPCYYETAWSYSMLTVGADNAPVSLRGVGDTTSWDVAMWDHHFGHCKVKRNYHQM